MKKQKTTKSKKAAILVHLPDAMKMQVVKFAGEQSRSVSSYVRLAILRQLVMERKKEANA